MSSDDLVPLTPATPSEYQMIRHALDVLEIRLRDMQRDINLYNGRVDLTLRLLARIIAKMDPAFTEDDRDPEVRRRSNLLTNTVIDRIRAEALAQASSNPEAFARLQRYFANIKPLSED